MSWTRSKRTEREHYAKDMNDLLVWIDCEMTGLDLGRDALVEVACVITDGELNQLDQGVDVVIKPRRSRWSRCRRSCAPCARPPACSKPWRGA